MTFNYLDKVIFDNGRTGERHAVFEAEFIETVDAERVRIFIIEKGHTAKYPVGRACTVKLSQIVAA